MRGSVEGQMTRWLLLAHDHWRHNNASSHGLQKCLPQDHMTLCLATWPWRSPPFCRLLPLPSSSGLLFPPSQFLACCAKVFPYSCAYSSLSLTILTYFSPIRRKKKSRQLIKVKRQLARAHYWFLRKKSHKCAEISYQNSFFINKSGLGRLYSSTKTYWCLSSLIILNSHLISEITVLRLYCI